MEKTVSKPRNLVKTPRHRPPRDIENSLYMGLSGHKVGMAITMAVFHNIGGVKKMSEWAEENPEAFYTKLFTKTISAPKQVEVTQVSKVEDLVHILDLEENGEYTESSVLPASPQDDYTHPDFARAVSGFFDEAEYAE